MQHDRKAVRDGAPSGRSHHGLECQLQYSISGRKLWRSPCHTPSAGHPSSTQLYPWLTKTVDPGEAYTMTNRSVDSVSKNTCSSHKSHWPLDPVMACWACCRKGHTVATFSHELHEDLCPAPPSPSCSCSVHVEWSPSAAPGLILWYNSAHWSTTDMLEILSEENIHRWQGWANWFHCCVHVPRTKWKNLCVLLWSYFKHYAVDVGVLDSLGGVIFWLADFLFPYGRPRRLEVTRQIQTNLDKSFTFINQGEHQGWKENENTKHLRKSELISFLAEKNN